MADDHGKYTNVNDYKVTNQKCRQDRVTALHTEHIQFSQFLHITVHTAHTMRPQYTTQCQHATHNSCNSTTHCCNGNVQLTWSSSNSLPFSILLFIHLDTMGKTNAAPGRHDRNHWCLWPHTIYQWRIPAVNTEYSSNTNTHPTDCGGHVPPTSARKHSRDWRKSSIS